MCSIGIVAQPFRWWRDTKDGDVVWMEWFPSNSQHWFTAPPNGRVAIPTDDLVAAVEDFDNRFIAAMDKQIQAAANGDIDASIRVDLDQLFVEHQKRSEHLALSRQRQLTTDWDAIRQGALEIQLA